MRLAAILLALAFAVPADAAIVQVQSGEPDDQVAGLVAAERAFARRALDTSIRDAFFDNLADNSILFRPEAVNGKQFFRGRPSNPGPALRWYPSYAELSSTGDLGWTTGPWEYSPAKDKPAEAWGHFATVWQRQADGKWKVVFDEGHSCARPPQDSLTWARTPARLKKTQDMASLVEFAAGNSKLMAVDAAYSEALAKEGIAAALAKFGDDDVRLLREDKPALTGADAAGRELAHEWDRGVVAWDTRVGAISKSADLAFSYGTAVVPGAAKVPAGKRKIFRVWRRDASDDWKLALDVTNAIPAPPPPPKAPKKP